MSSPASLSLRYARPADARALADLEAMEEVVLHGPVLLATRDDRVVAALSLHDGTVAADPFARTADAVALLRFRAAQERRSAAPRRRFGLRRPVRLIAG